MICWASAARCARCPYVLNMYLPEDSEIIMM